MEGRTGEREMEGMHGDVEEEKGMGKEAVLVL